eukprot:TRINITY_DN1194_c0_g1_i15.p1 TRINITY_DN1194_c0_g1~~TRINITY_DN1194_c0_g1_i15.p1  ORF type:complete len:1243 (-),score=233.02 TRINITY_DN1194_c0_g1_i15:64-3792(-)
MSGLPWLISVDMPENRLSGTLSRSSITPYLLQILNIAENNFLSGTIPDPYTSLQYLKELRLSDNSISGIIPVGIMTLTRLEKLRVYNNSLSGDLPSLIWKLSSLDQLHIQQNSLSGFLPTELNSLTLLTEIRMSINSLSGTLPLGFKDFHLLKKLEAGSNAFSGTLPGFTNLTLLTLLDLFENNFSGTLPAHLASVTRLKRLFVHKTKLSGTLPKVVLGFATLEQISAGECKFSGTIPPMTASPSLSDIFLQNNRLSGEAPHVSIRVNDLWLHANRISGTLSSALLDLTNLVGLGLYQNRISGTIPASISRLSSLKAFSLGGASLSGTLPSSIFSLTVLELLSAQKNMLSGTISHPPWSMQTLTLSGNRKISGTVPAYLLAFTSLRSLLLNSMSLSGTLPTHSNSTWNSTLGTLSVARNFMEGTTDALGNLNALQTLILSGNYFSCDAVDLNSAPSLGSGTFKEPVTEALIQIGEQMAKSNKPNAFKSLVAVEYSNIVLAFAGNPQLTTHASTIPPRDVGRVRLKDEIQQGQKGMFPGYTSLWQLAFVTIPFFVAVHTAVVLFAVSSRFGLSVSAVKSYFFPQQVCGHMNVHIQLYRSLNRTMLRLLVLGLCFVLLNALSPGVFDSGCTDPLLRTSIAPIKAGVAYQWTWVVLSSLMMAVAIYLFYLLGSSDQDARARSVHRCLCNTMPQSARAIKQWQQGVQRSKRLLPYPIRITLFVLLHIPVLLLASLPAFGYVLAQNVPAGSGFGYTVLGNSMVIAIVKTGFNSLVVPKAAAVLSKFKHGVQGAVSATSECVIGTYKTEVGIILVLEASTVLLAPMVSVFLLDESCLRFYLSFSDDLRVLLEAWDIAQTGASAYRTQFCSRRLVTEFSYVWLSILLLNTFVTPAIRLVHTFPQVIQLQDTIRARISALRGVEPEPADQEQLTLQNAQDLQQELAGVFNTMLTALVFGVLLPPLCLLLPLWGWLNLCSLEWETNCDNCRSFGERLAQRILVQPPSQLFQGLTLFGNWSISAFVFLDLEFGLGPSLFFVVASVIEVIAVCWLHRGTLCPARQEIDTASVFDPPSLPDVSKAHWELEIDVNPLGKQDPGATPTLYSPLSQARSRHTVQAHVSQVSANATSFTWKERKEATENRDFWKAMEDDQQEATEVKNREYWTQKLSSTPDPSDAAPTRRSRPRRMATRVPVSDDQTSKRSLSATESDRTITKARGSCVRPMRGRTKDVDTSRSKFAPHEDSEMVVQL